MTRVDFGAMTGGAKRDSIRMARALRRETNVRREARCEERCALVPAEDRVMISRKDLADGS